MLIEKSEFLNWGFGNVLENRTRGILAEYIVAKGLDALSEKRIEWDYCDLRYKDIEVEVKSAAYIQAWDQNQPSKISFEIGTRRWKWAHGTNEMVEIKPAARPAQVYIFSLFEVTDRALANPLDTTQWRFFVAPTVTINRHFGAQKRVGLASIERIAKACSFSDLRVAVDKALDHGPLFL